MARPAVPAMHPEGFTLADVRPRIQSGDVVLFQGKYLVSGLYRAVTGGDWYTHAAIVTPWDSDWVLLQAEAAGVQAVEFRNAVERYDGLADWYALTPECRAQLSLDDLLREARRDLGMPFGVIEFLTHISHWWLGFTSPRRSGHESAFFCSQYVSHCFRKAGVVLTGLSDADTMPDDVSRSGSLQRMGPIRIR